MCQHADTVMVFLGLFETADGVDFRRARIAGKFRGSLTYRVWSENPTFCNLRSRIRITLHLLNEAWRDMWIGDIARFVVRIFFSVFNIRYARNL